MIHEIDPKKEHQEWNRQHVFWLEDLDRWHKERGQARETLKRLEHFLSEHEAVDTRHRESMVALEQERARHQRHLDAQAETAEEREFHQSTRRNQELQGALHAKLAAHHQALMANIQSLQTLVAEFTP